MPTQTSTITGAVQAIVFPPFETFSSCVLLFDVPSDGAGLSLRSNYHDRRGDANRRRPRITLVGASTTETCFMSLSCGPCRQGPQAESAAMGHRRRGRGRTRWRIAPARRGASTCAVAAARQEATFCPAAFQPEAPQNRKIEFLRQCFCDVARGAQFQHEQGDA
jgi:hypothetical protein